MYWCNACVCYCMYVFTYAVFRQSLSSCLHACLRVLMCAAARCAISAQHARRFFRSPQDRPGETNSELGYLAAAACTKARRTTPA